MGERRATSTTRSAIEAVAARLPTHDGADFEDATRGFVGRRR